MWLLRDISDVLQKRVVYSAQFTRESCVDVHLVAGMRESTERHSIKCQILNTDISQVCVAKSLTCDGITDQLLQCVTKRVTKIVLQYLMKL